MITVSEYTPRSQTSGMLPRTSYLSLHDKSVYIPMSEPPGLTQNTKLTTGRMKLERKEGSNSLLYRQRDLQTRLRHLKHR